MTASGSVHRLVLGTSAQTNAGAPSAPATRESVHGGGGLVYVHELLREREGPLDTSMSMHG